VREDTRNERAVETSHCQRRPDALAAAVASTGDRAAQPLHTTLTAEPEPRRPAGARRQPLPAAARRLCAPAAASGCDSGEHDSDGASGPRFPASPPADTDAPTSTGGSAEAPTEAAPAAVGRQTAPPGRHTPGSPPRRTPTHPAELWSQGLDRYLFEHEQGRGGIGLVMRARDRKLDRTVAIKVLQRRTPESEARFLREARITARLQHPSIVPVHDLGTTARGEPYYAMKLVEGHSLREKIEQTTTLDQRLALLPAVLAVADAIAFAHARGIVHRDLKPANIIVGDYGEAVVVDWGLARDDHDELRHRSDREVPHPQPASAAARPIVSRDATAPGAILGTPAYMPPEQARGEAVDRRADVYALGAILYHILSGLPPFTGDCGKAVLAQVRTAPPPPVRQLEPRIPADLSAIVVKAMGRAPDQRYPDAAGFAADLRQFLGGQLVTAHSYTRAQLLHRWLHRHRAAVSVAVIACLLLLSSLLTSVGRIIRERDAAEIARRRASRARANTQLERNRLVLAQAAAALERNPTETIAWLRRYPISNASAPTVQRLAADALSRGIVEHLHSGRWGAVLRVVAHRDGTVFLSTEDGGLRRASPAQEPALLARGLSGRGLFALSSDGQQLAHETPAGLAILDLASGRHRPLAGQTGRVLHLTFAPGAHELVSTGSDGTVRLWQLDSGQSRVLATVRGAVHKAEFAPSGQLLTFCDTDGRLTVLHLRTGATHTLAHSHARQIMDFSYAPDGRWLAWTLTDGSVHLHATATGRTLPLRDVDRAFEPMASATIAEGLHGQIRFSTDSEYVAAAGHGGLVRVWHTGDARLAARVPYGGQIFWLGFAPDRPVLAVTGERAAIVLHDLPTGTQHQLKAHERAVYSAAFLSSGALVSGGTGKLAFWRLPVMPAATLARAADALFHVLPTRDGRLLSDGRDGTIRSIELDTGEVHTLTTHDAIAYGIVLDADQRTAPEPLAPRRNHTPRRQLSRSPHCTRTAPLHTAPRRGRSPR
jgi:serine/threonine protein kinase/WD40 repeat protein